MKIAKLRNVKTPNRGTEKSAGIDFYTPKFDDQFIKDFQELNKSSFCIESMVVYKEIQLKPQQRVLIPSGIKVNFEGEPKALMGVNKSGIGVKKGLSLLAKLVDQDYTGEIFINMVNTGNETVTIDEDSKITQFVLVPVFYDDIEEVDIESLYEKETQRGSGAMGSTGV